MKKLKSFLLSASLIALLFACSKKQAAEIKPDGPTTVTTANVTYSNFAGALFQNKCASCHGQNGAIRTVWLFNGLASIKNDVRVANSVLVTKTMPKGSTLTANELALLQAWFDRNTPE